MKTSLLKKICTGLVLCMLMQNVVFVNAAGNATLFADGEEIGYWAPCTDTLKLVTDAGEDAEISLLDLGSSVLYQSESDVEFTILAEDDGVILQLSEALKEKHKYRLVVDGKEINFKATTTGGKGELSDRIDFSGLTTDDLNNSPDAKPEKDTYVFGDEGLLIAKVSSETRISVEDETEATGKTGLKFVGRGNLNKSIQGEESATEGKIRIDARVKVLNGEFSLNVGNSENGLVTLVGATPNAATVSYQNAVTATGIKTKNAKAPADGWTEITYEMNLDDKSAAYTINGEEGFLDAGKMPYYNNLKINLLTDGVEYVQLNGSPTKGEYILDYVITTIYTDASDVEKITLIDTDDKAVSMGENTEVRPEIKRIDVKFNNNVNEDNLSYISVSDNDGNEVLSSGEYDSKTKTYSLYLPEYLEAFSEYTINIPKEEAGLVYEHSETFKTGEGKLAIIDFSITDESGNPLYLISDITDKVIVKLEILNTKLEDGKMTIVYTEGYDKFMTKMLSKDIEISKDNRKSEYTFEVDIEDKSEINEIKAFLWNDLKEHIPQYRAVGIY